MSLPEYVLQGEHARLFPVLSTNSKEGRTTSVFLSCLAGIKEFRAELLRSVGGRLGKTSRTECFTEVVLKHDKETGNDRPDGLIVVKTGKKEWRALIETKIGTAALNPDQIEKYRAVAKAHCIDCVITISNQFASLPSNHPLEETRKSKSKVPVFHWSWMFIMTQADLLLSAGQVADEDQLFILREFRRFLLHESAGVKGFSRMPPEWAELNKIVSAGGRILQKSPEAQATIAAWFQETKDLSLILSRQVETTVTERLRRAVANDVATREKEAAELLREHKCLNVEFDIPNAASPLVVTADLLRRTVDIGMWLRAPTDRQSSKARVNWLLRQIKTNKTEHLHIRLQWPGRSEDTQFSFAELSDDAGRVETGKEGLQVSSFFVFNAKRLGGRFIQQSNFIGDLEEIVPEFYREIGQGLREWRPPAPKIKKSRETSDDVSVEALEEDADNYLE